jgi:hypothetical protein
MSRISQFVELGQNVGQDIQVSGLDCFPESRWREAVLHYLFGVWSNNQQVMYRPKISFDGIVLRLDPTTQTYYAYGQAQHSASRRAWHALLDRWDRKCSGEILEVSCNKNEVEVALIRFVKDNQISNLTIHFRRVSASFSLCKTTRRGEYIVSGNELPTMKDILKFYDFEV